MALAIELIAVTFAVMIVWRVGSWKKLLRPHAPLTMWSSEPSHRSSEFRLADEPESRPVATWVSPPHRMVGSAPPVPTQAGAASITHAARVATRNERPSAATEVGPVGTAPVALFGGASDERLRLQHDAIVWCVPRGTVWLVSALGNPPELIAALGGLPLGAAMLPVTDRAHTLVLDGPRGVEEFDLAGVVTPTRCSTGQLEVSPVENGIRDGWMTLHSVTPTCYAAVVVQWSALGSPERLREPGRRLYERIREIDRTLIAEDCGHSAVRALEVWATELVGGSAGAVVAGAHNGEVFVGATDTVELAGNFRRGATVDDGIVQVHSSEPVTLRLPRFSEQAIRLQPAIDAH